MTDHLMELQIKQDDERKTRREILGKLNSIISENEAISLENAKLKVRLSTVVKLSMKLFQCVLRSFTIGKFPTLAFNLLFYSDIIA